LNWIINNYENLNDVFEIKIYSLWYNIAKIANGFMDIIYSDK